MNYFELFGIPVALTVDKNGLSKRYFDLQKQFHPDYFANGSDDEKEEALEKSSIANKAYKTFQSQDATIKYVLQLKGLLEEEEKYKLPPAFLMEVLELNELKMEDAEPAEIIARTNALQQEIYGEVKPIFDNALTDDASLLKVKDYYYKKRYLDKLLEN